MFKKTVGLNCSGHGRGSALVSVAMEIYSSEPDVVYLLPTSGYSGSPYGSPLRITLEEWENRPHDPYDSIVEARWALGLLGYSINT